MTKVRFIHTADLHLDTPFKGLASWNRELAVRLQDATFHSYEKIIAICITEKVDFLIISGDIFDSESKSLAAQLRFVSGLQKLSGQGIATYFVCGNHDPLNSWLDAIQLPDHVHRFDASRAGCFTYEKEGEPAADIYGTSFQEKVVRRNLALDYKLTGHASPVSIAVLHGTIGTPGLHENYAPFKIEDVMNKGFDYWAMGHIHKRTVVHDSHPAIVYPGNPQGRDFGETGAKGCCLVDIIPGNGPLVKFMPVHTIRFEEIAVDLTGETEMTKLSDKIEKTKIKIDNYSENDSYILRVNLTGRTPLHEHLNRPEEMQQLLDYFNEGQLDREHFTWIDQININTNPDIDIDQVRKGTDFSADLLKVFDAYENDEKQLSRLFQELDEEIINYQVKKETTAITEHEKTEILNKAKWMMLDQLLKKA
ncbi:MAG: DNA repair exonuclease [Bacteroidales bacterium]|nr:DNA repair exonuclease [Bacteroidales bacterium]